MAVGYNIAVWYHCRLFGGDPAIDPDFSIPLMMEQMELLKACGLAEAASEIHVCVNGDASNAIAAKIVAPSKAAMTFHGHDSKSLLPTIHSLRGWCASHPGWIVCFFHSKGVTHPTDALTHRWRKCMERHVIQGWRKCVFDLTHNGNDTVGAHWLTKEKYGNQVTRPFWGGMFFWAKSNFLAELPEIPQEPKSRGDWFLAENWIGMGRKPKIVDYAPHWPGLSACSQ